MNSKTFGDELNTCSYPDRSGRQACGARVEDDRVPFGEGIYMKSIP